jgi:hypothetical protein
MLSPLITPTQTLGPQNLTTQKRFNHVTLSPKSGRIVRPTEIVTLRPQKVGRSVTAEHYDPVVFLVSTVCDIKSQIPGKTLKRPSQYCLIHSIHVNSALYSESSNIGLVVLNML